MKYTARIPFCHVAITPEGALSLAGGEAMLTELIGEKLRGIFEKQGLPASLGAALLPVGLALNPAWATLEGKITVPFGAEGAEQELHIFSSHLVLPLETTNGERHVQALLHHSRGSFYLTHETPGSGVDAGTTEIISRSVDVSLDIHGAALRLVAGSPPAFESIEVASEEIQALLDGVLESEGIDNREAIVVTGLSVFAEHGAMIRNLGAAGDASVIHLQGCSLSGYRIVGTLTIDTTGRGEPLQFGVSIDLSGVKERPAFSLNSLSGSHSRGGSAGLHLRNAAVRL